VAQQLAHGHLVVRQLRHGNAIGHLFLRHHQGGELWNVVLYRVIQGELALFEKHHHGHAGDGLGHGEDAEDRVFGHGHLILQVLPAVGVGVHQLAVSGHHRDQAGQLPLVHFGTHAFLKGSEARAAHPHTGGVGSGKSALGILCERQAAQQRGKAEEQRPAGECDADMAETLARMIHGASEAGQDGHAAFGKSPDLNTGERESHAGGAQ
jgi:hypothetical protein